MLVLEDVGSNHVIVLVDQPSLLVDHTLRLH